MTIERELADLIDEKPADESPMKKRRKQARQKPVKRAVVQTAPPELPEPLVTGEAALVISEATKRQMRLIERRLKNPNVTDDRTILLKDKSLVIHIFNGEKAGRLYHAVHRLGWRPLHVDELVAREQIGDISTTKEGWVVRGEKGREMFMVMPRDAFNKIARKKVDMRERKSLHKQGARRQREEVAEATAAQFGDQAGEEVRKFHGTNPDHSVVMELDS